MKTRSLNLSRNSCHLISVKYISIILNSHPGLTSNANTKRTVFPHLQELNRSKDEANKLKTKRIIVVRHSSRVQEEILRQLYLTSNFSKINVFSYYIEKKKRREEKPELWGLKVQFSTVQFSADAIGRICIYILDLSLSRLSRAWWSYYYSVLSHSCTFSEVFGMRGKDLGKYRSYDKLANFQASCPVGGDDTPSIYTAFIDNSPVIKTLKFKIQKNIFHNSFIHLRTSRYTYPLTNHQPHIAKTRV